LRISIAKQSFSNRISAVTFGRRVGDEDCEAGMNRHKKKKRLSRAASIRAASEPNTILQREFTRPAQHPSLTGSKLIFTILTVILLPSVFVYWQVAEPNLAGEGPPILTTGRADPGPHSARILTTFKEHVRNRGWRAGHIDHVEIRPLKFDQPVDVEVRYIDKRSIPPFQEKLLTFQFVQTVRHTGDNTFVVTLVDSNGKQIEEFQCGNTLWLDGGPAPPKRDKPLIPD
jgi:hypothetical protein